MQPMYFLFKSHSVRIVIGKDDEPWFVASDVASILGYRNAPDMTRMLDADEAATHNLRSRSENGVEQAREVTVISESGLYAAIRKTGRYEAEPSRATRTNRRPSTTKCRWCSVPNNWFRAPAYLTRSCVSVASCASANPAPPSPPTW